MRIPVESTSARHGSLHTVARWLVLATVLLILYGSLYPFRFSALGEYSIWELLRSLSFQRTSRSDVVANLLLYLPLGLCLMLAWPAHWRRLTLFGWSVGWSTVLSILVEVLQIHAPSRVSSLTDVLLNAAGAAVGALLATVYMALGRSLRIPGMSGGQPEPAPLAVVLLWLGFRLAPFIPVFDWQKYREALTPIFQDPQFAVTDTLRFLVGWLVAGYAVRQVWRREWAIPAFVSLVALTLVGRIVIAGKTLVMPELLGLTVAVGAGAFLIMIPDRRRCAILAALLAVVILLEGLKPFDFLDTPNSFSWVPFKSSLSDSLEINYWILLEKCFWYFSLVWLLARRGVAIAGAAIATAALLAVIEIVQLWLPERSAEITDPLMALAAGVLVALLRTGLYSKR